MADDATCGSSFTITNQLKLGPLQDNGGPTLTHAISPGPAFDAGSCETPKDQRGASRPFPTGGKCDIGAYEWGIHDLAENTFGMGGGTVTTDSEGDGATPSDRVETTVTTPNGGFVSIQESDVNLPAPHEFRFLYQQVYITAPEALDGAWIEIVFWLDASLYDKKYDVNEIAVYKDLGVLPDCGPTRPILFDPCVASRVRLDDPLHLNDVVITVLTTTASVWNFGVPVVNVDAQIQVISVERPLAGKTQPGGIFPMKATLKNIGPDLSNLFFRVAALSYLDGIGPHPELANRNPGSPAGVGAELDAELPGGTWENGETFSITFNVLVPKVAKFVAIVHAFTLAPAP